ncbi:MAG: hypothetical protein QOG69_812 [Actinomycetota bacterium]|jgi:hypothetical protein|nr:hypothetical protein [Actinomycetota bacterium]
MGRKDALHEQLESLHVISVEIAALRDMAELMTGSECRWLSRRRFGAACPTVG